VEAPTVSLTPGTSDDGATDKSMGILVLGVSHHAAPLEVRERLAFGPDTLPSALEALGRATREGVLLSTCNRTEVYAVVGHHRTGRDQLVRFLVESTGLPAPAFTGVAYDHWQEEAVRHLFRVAAGLDSMLVGEPQILGQVRAAFEAAARLGSAGPVLSRLFRQALEVGKKARTETGISRKAISVSFAAVELARQTLGSLEGQTVLVAGAGEAGELAARTLLKHGARRLLVWSRTQERARAVAARCGGTAVGSDALEEACVQADVIIACTAAPRPILSRALLAAALARRPERPLLVVDIAMPRDVEPEAAKLPGLHLRNLDDLRALVAANLEARRGEMAAVEALIDREVPRFLAWRDSLDSTPAIRALLAHAEAIRQAELERALRRLPELSERDREIVTALSRAIVNKLLHEPLVRLKHGGSYLDAQGYARLVSELFSLDAEEHGGAACLRARGRAELDVAPVRFDRPSKEG